MGYRSEVRVMTDTEGFEKMQEIIWKLNEKVNLSPDFVLFPATGQDPEEVFDYYDAQGDYVCFGFEFIKWYDAYKEVALFMNTLKVANDNGINWQFIRVGEECGDIENESSDNFYNSDIPGMGTRVEIVY